jgi:hypothetical protein
MKPRRRALLLALLLIVAGGLAWWLWPEPDPLFHGKPESAWIKSIEYNGSDEQTKQWREFGPEGVRVLIRGLEKADRPWERLYRKTYRQLAPRLPFGLARLLPAPPVIYSGGTRMRACGDSPCHVQRGAVSGEPGEQHDSRRVQDEMVPL